MGARVTRQLCALVTVCCLAACEAGPVAPVGRGSTGPVAGSGPTAATGIAGTWRRTLVFLDEFGFLHSSETTWTFTADGGAFRAIVTRNHTLGAFDTSVATARWRLDGGNLIIDFLTPSPGTIVLEVRLQGTSLFLAGQEYLRVT